MHLQSLSLFCLGLAPSAVLVSAGCPFLAKKQAAAAASAAYQPEDSEAVTAYRRALMSVDFEEVQVDLVSLFHTSQDW
jgi:hypothetical protein